MTTTENTTRPSNNSITRRKMLQSVAISSAAAVAASISPTMAFSDSEAGQASPQLLDLILHHRRAWDLYGKAIDDACSPNHRGLEAEAIKNMWCDTVQEAHHLILNYPIATLADARAKAQHFVSQDFGLDDDGLNAVLASIADCAPQSHMAKWTEMAAPRPVLLLVDELIDAIAAETHAFLTAPNDDEGQAITDASIDRVMAAKDELLAVPNEHLLNDSGAAKETVLALALLQRRWLVMEGSYQSENKQEECLLVDLLLQGTRFDKVPLLWHVDGDTRDSRPSGAELQAGWGAKPS